ncbi:hypothetical protein B2G88_03145 [Natronolimnobius baerhuensis]|uniref:Uncharacterized protein n=2 Tax=Natronolimnobius baerhuensis TaxID=253108 RepID=A0A202EC39_9EURY|nr:hypothetical protein B2G88_03145 [Natronolimnobius baerhuensis]
MRTPHPACTFEFVPAVRETFFSPFHSRVAAIRLVASDGRLARGVETIPLRASGFPAAAE